MPKLKDVDFIRMETREEKKMFVCRCKMCGKETIGKGPRMFCETCAIINNRERCARTRHLYRKKKQEQKADATAIQKNSSCMKKSQPGIKEVAAAAHAAGMSYGKWVAMMYAAQN